VIIGLGPLTDAIEQRIDRVAPFRVARFKQIAASYEADPNSITSDDACFVFRCGCDVVENKPFP
jgi:hypothetical protein